MRAHSVSLADVTLEVEVHGGDDGPLAVLLHGFPDTRYTFRHLAPYLVSLGYRVVVPAQRGYAPSSCSSEGNYSIAALAHDANELHQYFDGDESAVLIGHDWGAAATYVAVASAPQRWRTAVTMAVPPLAIFAQAFMTYDQLRLSWYMFFFQSPLANVVVANDDLAFLARLWNDWSPGFAHEHDVAAVRAALSSPENLDAALGYYRAMLNPTPVPAYLQYAQDQSGAVADRPFLYLHGANDGCVSPAVVDNTLAFLGTGSDVAIIEHAGHFLHLEQPDEVHHLIGEFLSRS